jgi:hypothetical protein
MAFAAYGIDPMQALVLSFQRIRLELALLRSKGLKITWLGQEDGLGFPRFVEDEPSPEEWERTTASRRRPSKREEKGARRLTRR